MINISHEVPHLEPSNQNSGVRFSSSPSNKDSKSLTDKPDKRADSDDVTNKPSSATNNNDQVHISFDGLEIDC